MQETVDNNDECKIWERIWVNARLITIFKYEMKTPKKCSFSSIEKFTLWPPYMWVCVCLCNILICSRLIKEYANMIF